MLPPMHKLAYQVDTHKCVSVCEHFGQYTKLIVIIISHKKHQVKNIPKTLFLFSVF